MDETMCEKEREQKIFDRLKEDYEYLKSLNYGVVGVFLQGSDNYMLSYERSDIDTKAIIIPKLNDIALNKDQVSTTIIKEDNSHLDVKDIRLMMTCFKKQNINFVEILFTKYFILNPDYADLFKQVIDNNEKIAHYDVGAFLNCTAGTSKEKLKALDLDRPSQHNEIEEYGWASKQLHHIIRLNTFINRYIKGESFADCLIDSEKNRKYLIDLKKNGHNMYDIEEAKKLAKEYCDKTVAAKNAYLSSNKFTVNTEVKDLLNEVTTKIIKKSLKMEIMSDEEEK